MREKAVQFGKSARLAGILCEPTAANAVADRPAFLLLNSGILHRVGSCRLWVRTARTLAESGFTALRFDYSGIGDSEPRRDSLSFEESAPAETREAMDYLQRSRGIDRFVLLGLCSGSDMAHVVATQDERVVGIVGLDPWAYRTPMFTFHYYWSRVFQGRIWRRWIRMRIRRALGETSGRRTPAQSTDAVLYDVPKYVRVFPPREKVAAELKDFVARKIQIFFIFTGGQGDDYNHRSQYRNSFREIDFGKQLRVEYVPEADHIVTGLGEQQLVLDEVRRWALSSFDVSATHSDRIPASMKAKSRVAGASR